MKYCAKFIFAIAFGFINLYGQREAKPVLAVLSLSSQNVSPADTSIIMGFIQEEFFYTMKFQLVEREQIDKLLKEIQYQQSGLCDVECAVNLGKQLAAQKVVSGSVGRLGNAYVIQLSMIDVATSAIESMFSIREECPLEQLPGYISKLIKGVISPGNRQNQAEMATQIRQTQINPRTSSIKQSTTKTLRKKSPFLAFGMSFLVPGLGQYYNGHVLKGLVQEVLIGGGILLAGLAGEKHVQRQDQYYDYYYNNYYYYYYMTHEQTAWLPIGLGLAGAAVLWSWIDAPISAGKINRKRAGLSAHMMEFRLGKEEYLGLDIRPIYKGYAATLSFNF
jgi:TM2 domain-containing membrane protein YozV